MAQSVIVLLKRLGNRRIKNGMKAWEDVEINSLKIGYKIFCEMLSLERAQNEIHVLKASEYQTETVHDREIASEVPRNYSHAYNESFSGEINGFSTKQNLR